MAFLSAQLAAGVIAMFGLGAFLHSREEGRIAVAREASELSSREPQSLEALRDGEFASQHVSARETLKALEFLRDHGLENEAERLRPGDRFTVELAHLAIRQTDCELDYLWSSLGSEFRMPRAQLERAMAQTLTVADFIKLHATLSAGRLKKVWPSIAL